jgi:hypothetical protein
MIVGRFSPRNGENRLMVRAYRAGYACWAAAAVSADSSAGASYEPG